MTHYNFIKTGTCIVLLSIVPMTGVAGERAYDFSDFDAINVTSGLGAIVTIGAGFSVVAQSRSEKALNRLDFEVIGSTLVLDRTKGRGGFSLFATHKPVTIKITMPLLNKLEASAGASVQTAGVSGDVLSVLLSSGATASLGKTKMQEISLKVSSGSSLGIDGQCQHLEVHASSGSNVSADGFECDVVDANSSSGSNVSVHANLQAEVSASSGANIGVFGNPGKLQAHESSGGSVRSN